MVLVLLLSLASNVALGLIASRWRKRAVKASSEIRRVRRVLSGEPLTDLDQVELQLFRCRTYLTSKDLAVPSTLDNLARRSILQTVNLHIGQAIDHLHVYKAGPRP